MKSNLLITTTLVSVVFFNLSGVINAFDIDSGYLIEQEIATLEEPPQISDESKIEDEIEDGTVFDEIVEEVDEPANVDQSTPSSPEDLNVEIPIEIEIEPTMINVEVALNTAFVINPNASPKERFVSPSLYVKNNSVAPLKIEAVSLKSSKPEPQLVSPFKFTDSEWANLGIEDTQKYLALGLIVSSKSQDAFFFEKEVPDNPICLNDKLLPSEAMSIQFIAKHGLSWVVQEPLQYKLTLKFSLID